MLVCENVLTWNAVPRALMFYILYSVCVSICCLLSIAGASIPMGQGDMSPNIYEGRGTSMVMSPQYFISDVV